MSIYGAVSSGSLSTMRGSGTHAKQSYLTVVPPAVVMTAQVNGYITNVPAGTVAIDGASFGSGFSAADLLEGLVVWIGTAAGYRDVFQGRIRTGTTTTSLKLEEFGLGGTTIPMRVYRRIRDNYYVTILDTYALEYAFPRIDLATNIIYKDWDLSLTDQNTTPPPIANIRFSDGTQPVGFCDTTYRVKLDGTNSFEVPGGGAVTSYLWALPASGATLVGGYALSDSIIEVDVDADTPLWIKLTVTDSNAKTAYARMHLSYYDSTEPTTIHEVTSDLRTRQSRSIGLRLDPNDYDLANIPHGSMCYYWEVQTFGSSTVAETSDWSLMWLNKEEATFSASFPDTTVELLGPGDLLQHLPATTQRLEAASSPANWQEIVPGMCNVNGAAYYLLRWHLFALTVLCDINLLNEDWGITAQPAFGSADLGAPSVGGQLEALASRVSGNFGSDSQGGIHLVRNPQYLFNRETITTRMTLQEADWARVSSGRSHKLDTGMVAGSGFFYYGGAIEPVKAVAPSLIQGQSPVATEMDAQIISSQADLNRRTGAHWATMNNPLSDVEIELTRMLDVFEPALIFRVAVQVTAAMLTDPVFGTAWQRLLDAETTSAETVNMYLHSVSIRHVPASSRKTITLRLEAEVTPVEGQTYPIPRPDEYPETETGAGGNVGGYQSDGYPAPIPDVQYDEFDPLFLLVKDGSNLVLVYTSNFRLADSPEYVALKTFAYNFSGNEQGLFWIDESTLSRAFALYGQGAGEWPQCDNLYSDAQNWTAGTLADSTIGVTQSLFNPEWVGQAGVNTGLPQGGYPLTYTTYARFYYQQPLGVATTVKVYEALYQESGYLTAGMTPGVDAWGAGVVYMGVATIAAPKIYSAVNWGASVGDWSVQATTGTLSCPKAFVIPPLNQDGTANTDGQYGYAFVWAKTGETQTVVRTQHGFSINIDVSPSISGSVYGVGEYARTPACYFEEDGSKVAFIGYEVGGNGRKLIVTDDAGASWSAPWAGTNSVDYWFVSNWPIYDPQCVIWGGLETVNWTDDWFGTTQDKSGNLTDLFGAGWSAHAFGAPLLI